MLFYKGFGIRFDELAKDYEVLAGNGVSLTERFGNLSYVYDMIDLLIMDYKSEELRLQMYSA